MNNKNNNRLIRIGFIGAGRVGCSLGKYFSKKGLCVAGYYSRTGASAKEAALFTDTLQYDDIKSLIEDCNVIFITVPDKAIKEVWDIISVYNITGKIICHCSGAMSSDVFSGITLCGAYGYSVHPLCAVNSRTESFKTLESTYFTIEGNKEKILFIKELISGLGNKVSVIDAADKVRYHAAAVLASNLCISLYSAACTLLTECGFLPEEAHTALSPLFTGNCLNIAGRGPADALTGPIDRNDTVTVIKHLNNLDGNIRQIYRYLSLELIKTAKIKNPDTDYTYMTDILSGNIDLEENAYEKFRTDF